MNKQKITTYLLYIVSVVIIGFGVLYIYTGFTSGLMPYHIKFLGKSCDELPPNVCELMKTFVQIIGFAFTSIGVAFFMVTRGMFNRLQDEHDWKIIVEMIVILIPIAPIMYHLAPYTPWYVVAGIFVLAIIALILGKPKHN